MILQDLTPEIFKKKGDELILSVEIGRWVARDKEGKIVERN